MICSQCHERDAVVHLTQIVENAVTQVHLCEQCAAERGIETNVSLPKHPLGDFLQAAQQQIEAMMGQMQAMHEMLLNVNQSFEARDVQVREFEAKIKAFDAETKRISATMAGMTMEQIQDIVMGTIAAAQDVGDLIPPPSMQGPVEEGPQHEMAESPALERQEEAQQATPMPNVAPQEGET